MWRGLRFHWRSHLAVLAGWTDVASALIERGCEVDAVDERGDTPLHLAVRRRHVESVRLLVESGASVRRRNERGRTVADEARYAGLSDQRVGRLLRRR